MHLEDYCSNFLVKFLVFASILKEEEKLKISSIFPLRLGMKINKITLNVQQV